MDYYAELAVDASATASEIKKAYRKLALEFHPDRAEGRGEDPKKARKRFVRLQEAYDVLSDSTARKAYDATRRGKSPRWRNRSRDSSTARPWPWEQPQRRAKPKKKYTGPPPPNNTHGPSWRRWRAAKRHHTAAGPQAPPGAQGAPGGPDRASTAGAAGPTEAPRPGGSTQKPRGQRTRPQAPPRPDFGAAADWMRRAAADAQQPAAGSTAAEQAANAAEARANAQAEAVRAMFESLLSKR